MFCNISYNGRNRKFPKIDMFLKQCLQNLQCFSPGDFMHRTVGVGIHKNPKHFLPPSGKLNFFWSKWLHLKTEELRKCYSLTSSKICLLLRPAISKFLSERINWIISRIPSDLFFILREPTSQDQLMYILCWKIPIHWKSFYKKCALFVINRLLVLTTFCWLMASLKHEKIVPIIYSFYGLKVLKFIHSHFLKRNFYFCFWGH